MYFEVVFLDQEMCIPSLIPVVFVGRDLDGGTKGDLYFQDYRSYRDGKRFKDGRGAKRASRRVGTGTIEIVPADEEATVLEFDQALETLLRCSLQRRETRIPKKKARTAKRRRGRMK